jgi:large subunit ribosomal protein L6
VSRIGRMPIDIPANVDVDINGLNVKVKGPKGEITHSFPPVVEIAREGDQILVNRKSEEKFSREMHGTTRSVLNNMLVGVSDGFFKVLEVHGVGYRPELKGKQLILYVGYSHPVEFKNVEGISFEVDEEAGQIKVLGFDKSVVGEVAARIRKIRPPEPYKGKGIRYKDEYVRRKAGKAGKAAL